MGCCPSAILDISEDERAKGANGKRQGQTKEGNKNIVLEIYVDKSQP